MIWIPWKNLSNLSRKICAEAPEISVARQWLKETDAGSVTVSWDSAFSRLRGSACSTVGPGWRTVRRTLRPAGGFVDRFMTDQKANSFFRILCSAFVLAIAAYGLGRRGHIPTGLGGHRRLDAAGAGTAFTNAMRDIIFETPTPAQIGWCR